MNKSNLHNLQCLCKRPRPVNQKISETGVKKSSLFESDYNRMSLEDFRR